MSDRVHVNNYLDFIIFYCPSDGWYYAYRYSKSPLAKRSEQIGKIFACDTNLNKLMRRCRLDFYGC